MSEVVAWWRQLGSLLVGLVLLFGLATAPADAQTFREYRPNTAFEEAVRKANPDCMPEPYKISSDPYTYRLLSSVYGQCLPLHYDGTGENYTKSNLSEDEVKKWMGLAVGSLANPGVATYAGGELMTAGAKCVLKSFVDASDEAGPQTKATLRSMIDGAGTLFDWYGFASDIPELANPSRVKSIEAGISVYLSSIDRLPEGASALEYLESTWNAGIQSLREIHDGPRITAWKATQFHMEQCEYDKARELLKLTREETDKACIAYGGGYRQAQKNMRIFMADNRRQVKLPLGSGDEAKGNYNLRLDAIKSHTKNLTKLINFYGELDLFERGQDGPDKKAREFYDMQTFYSIYAKKARGEIGTLSGCYYVVKAIELVSPKNLSPQCRVAFFHTKIDGTPRPEFLISDLADYSYRQRDERWAALEEVRTAHQQCDAATRDRKSAELRNLIATNPMYRVIDNACHELTQPELLARLDTFSKDMPDYCKMTTVPTAILGEPVGEAIKLLETAQLYISEIAKVEPKQGQTPGIVIDSLPVPGSSVRVHSLVGLTIIDEFPEDQTPDVEMVKVPALVPATEDGAKTALAGVGLKGVTGWEVLADKIELVPGNLVSASPATGDMVELGSTVTLTIIGPRPKVEVPSITAATTLEEAKGILEAAGFVPGDELESKQAAPAGVQTGVYYATHPPIGSTQEMFSVVAMIKYGLNRVPEAVIGMSPGDAAGVLAEGGKFTAGSVAQGIPVKEGEKPGMVQATIPAVGTPVVRGAVVNLIVGKPHTDATLAPDEDDLADNTDREPTPDPAWPPAELLGNPNVIYGPASCFTREGESRPFKLWRGPNGEWACILVDGASSADVSEDTEQEDELDDGGWIGRWVITGDATPDGKPSKINGILDISAQSDGLLMKWIIKKNGTYKKPLSLQMVADSAGVLRIHPKFIRELDARENGDVDGVIEEGFDKVLVLFAAIIRTLEISRSGTTCTVGAVDPKKGPQSVVVSCVRE